MDASPPGNGDAQLKLRSKPDSTLPLIVRLPNWVGEVVLTLPTLALLQRAGYDLHLVGKPWARDLFAGYEWPVYSRPATMSAAIAQLRSLKGQLCSAVPSFGRRTNTVLFTNSFSSALEARLAGLRAVGYAREARGFLLSQAVGRFQNPHAVDDYWRIGTALVASGAPQRPVHMDLAPAPAQVEQALSLLRERGIGAGYAVLCPFSGTSDSSGKKRWPAFPELAHQLAAQGVTIVLCPGPGEDAEAREHYPDAAIFTSISLGVYAALMRGAWCTIANDTGPGHLAAASGGTVVTVFGPQSTVHWAPFGPHATLIHYPSRWPTLEEVMVRLPVGRIQ